MDEVNEKELKKFIEAQKKKMRSAVLDSDEYWNAARNIENAEVRLRIIRALNDNIGSGPKPSVMHEMAVNGIAKIMVRFRLKGGSAHSMPVLMPIEVLDYDGDRLQDAVSDVLDAAKLDYRWMKILRKERIK